MARTTQVPELDALGEFALAAARNYRRLLGDADILLKHGRAPSAYSLAVLAFEEAGKAWLSVLAMMLPDNIRPEWPFDGLMAKHTDKLMAALAMANLLASASSGNDIVTGLVEIGEDLDQLAHEHDKDKQRGFYVDLLDGAVQEPATRITKNDARRMMDTVRGLLDHGAVLADPGFVAWVASPAPETFVAKETAWGVFAAGLETGTPEGMMAAMRNLYDETGATEGLPQMLREQAEIAGVGKPERVQPRKQPRSQRRGQR